MHLVTEYDLGDIYGGIIDKNNGAPKSRQIKSTAEEINDILGTNIKISDMSKILNDLGIKTETENGVLICDIPDYREDIENSYDLAEEVIRIYGYDVYDSGRVKEAYSGWKLTEGDLGEKTILERKIKNVHVSEEPSKKMDIYDDKNEPNTTYVLYYHSFYAAIFLLLTHFDIKYRILHHMEL